MLSQFNHDFGRNVVARRLREVVDDDGERRAVGNGAVEGEHVRRQHLLFVVMRGAHHGHVVAEFGSVFREAKSLDGRLNARPGNQDFVGRSGVTRALEHIPPLLIGEQDGFAGRSLHDDTRDRCTRVAVHVVFQLLEINVALGIKRRGDGRENSV